MTVHQQRALRYAQYWAGQVLIAGTDDAAREALQSAREYIVQVTGYPVTVTAETVHGIVAQLGGSGVIEC